MGLLTPSQGPRLGNYGSLPGSAGSTPTHRRRKEKQLRVIAAVAALAAAVLLLNSGVLSPADPALVAWTLKGCPSKILDLTTTMESQYKARSWLQGGCWSWLAVGAVGPTPAACCRKPCLAAAALAPCGLLPTARLLQPPARLHACSSPACTPLGRLSPPTIQTCTHACRWRWLRVWIRSLAIPPPASPKPQS